MSRTLHIANKNYSSWSLRPWLLMRVLGVPRCEHRHALQDAALRALGGVHDGSAGGVARGGSRGGGRRAQSDASIIRGSYDGVFSTCTDVYN